MDESTTYSKPKLKQVVMTIDFPACHAQTKSKIIHQLTKRQLRQFQSDSLNVYVFTNPPRLSLIAVPKTEGGIYLFAEDVDVAEACSEQFYSEAITRLQTLEPNVDPTGSPFMHAQIANTEATKPCKIVSFVARANAVPVGTPSVVDLMELESRILAKCDPSTVAVFEPDEYPSLVWLDLLSDEPMALDSSKLSSPDCEMTTLVFPSGAIVIHGPNWDRMEELLRRKLPLIQKCMVPMPDVLTTQPR